MDVWPVRYSREICQQPLAVELVEICIGSSCSIQFKQELCTVVCPRAEAHATQLFIKWELVNIDLTGWLEESWVDENDSTIEPHRGKNVLYPATVVKICAEIQKSQSEFSMIYTRENSIIRIIKCGCTPPHSLGESPRYCNDSNHSYRKFNRLVSYSYGIIFSPSLQ